MFWGYNSQQGQADYIRSEKDKAAEEMRFPLGPEWTVEHERGGCGYWFSLDGHFVASATHTGGVSITTGVSKENAAFITREIDNWFALKEQSRKAKEEAEKAELNATIDRYRK